MTLTMQDFGGKHNADLHGTRGRLLRGGSFKRQRIVVILPAIAPIQPKVALSHWNLIFPPNNGVCRIIAEGMEVGDAYSQAIAGILAHPELSKWEYILTIESDNLPPQDGVIKLCAQMEAHPELSCIGGLYYTKGHGGVPQIWGDPNDATLNFRPQLPEEGKLIECCGTGMGFNLWRMSLFKDDRLRKPWFKTVAGKEGCGTQDLHFWGDARKYGYRCAIDCSVTVGHMDDNGMVW
jgi:hypothetical protein